MAHETDKPLVLCKCDSNDETFNGVNEIFLARLQEDFRVVFYKELEADPSLGPRILGAVYLGGGLYERLHLVPNLKVVANHGAGVDHIRFDVFGARGIRVSNTPGVLQAAAADLAMALMLASARNLVSGVKEAMGPEPITAFRQNFLGVDVTGATLGIIGMGEIGLEVAKRAKAFSMTVLYHNRRKREVDLDVEYCEQLHSMLSRCDFVVITCSLTEQTRNLVGKEEFDAMKTTATLINVGRGKIVDHDALTNALQNKQIRAAAVDVTHIEPLPRDHPLLKMDNVIITPHWGSATLQTRTKMYDLVARNLMAGIKGEPLLTEVHGNN